MADLPSSINPNIESCEAMRITIESSLLTPVCMGGTAIAGCDKPKTCTPIFAERMSIEDPRHAYAVFIDRTTGKVQNTTRFARMPLMPVDPPPVREIK